MIAVVGVSAVEVLDIKSNTEVTEVSHSTHTLLQEVVFFLGLSIYIRYIYCTYTNVIVFGLIAVWVV